MGALHCQKYSDGELFARFGKSTRVGTVFLVALVKNLFELLLCIDAAQEQLPKKIICISTYLPHYRQKRKDAERTSISSRVIADFLQQSVTDRAMRIDLHTSSIEGFFKISVDHLDINLMHYKSIK